jgi:Lipoprotein LpqB beta-propeller domain/Sporulation and spore germination
MSGHRRTARRAAVAAGFAGLLATVAACATLPPAGQIKLSRVPGNSGPAQQGVVQFVPVGPGPRWQPTDIVRGFLIASAAFTSDPDVTVAREFLAPGYRNTWNPKSAGWAATVVDDSASIARASPLSPHVNGETNDSAVVDVASNNVATLFTGGRLQAGQYLVSATKKPLSFGLILTPQGWRINSLPWQTLLLLTRTDFLRDYQPRNLYFVAANAPHRLLPDPVFIPQHPGAEDTAIGLVQGLIPHENQGRPGPTDWLSGAATTAFPAGTGLLSVQVTGSQATVDLGGNAAKASQAQRQQMAAQLFWSLTTSSYGTPTAIRSVVMQINGRAWQPPGQQPQVFNDYQDWVPATPDSDVYFQRAVPGLSPVIRVLTRNFAGSTALTLPEDFGRGPLSALATSPGPSASAVLAGCRGRTVYLARVTRASTVRRQSLPAACTSLSWDRQDDLWVATRAGPYVLPPPATAGGTRQVRLVVSPVPSLQPPRSLGALRVAPDGVRAAMIVARNGTSRLLVAAISQHAGTYYLAQSTQTATVGSDIRGRPIALSWWDSDHLLVLVQSPGGGNPRLYEVPLNGGLSTQVPTPPPGSQWLAVTGTTVVTGTAPRHRLATGRIWKMSGLSGSWNPVTDGTMPVVPG